MLRCLAFAVLGLSLLSGPVAARGDGPSGGGRRAEAKATAVGGARAERAFYVRQVGPAPRRASASVGAGCVRSARGGGARCRGAAVRPVDWRWSQGLPPALGVQAEECPPGTMATLAEGHDDIVRCIPI